MNYIKLSKRPFSSTENIYTKNNKNNNYKNFISSFNSPKNKEIINSSLNNNTYSSNNNNNKNNKKNIQSSINKIYLNNNKKTIKNQLFLNSIDSNQNNNKSISIYKKNNKNNHKFYINKDKNISNSHLHINSNIHSHNNFNNKKKSFSMISLNYRKNSNENLNKKISNRLNKNFSNKTLNATNSAKNIYNKNNNNNKIENIKNFYTNLKKNKFNFYNNQYKNKFSINYFANYLKNTENINKNKNNSNKSVSINNNKILTEKISPKISLNNNSKSNRNNLNNNNNNFIKNHNENLNKKSKINKFNNNNENKKQKINKIFSQKEIFPIKYKNLTSSNSPNKNNINLNYISEKDLKFLNKNKQKTFINNFINQKKNNNNNKEFSLKINKIYELTKQKNTPKNLKNTTTNSTNTTDRIEALKNNLLINRRASNQTINNLKENTTKSSKTHDKNYYFSQYLKLSNFIKNFYKKNNEYPNTLLTFYKYGRLIGQGAFGKVNLGLNILTGRIVAIKSFNKQIVNQNKEKILYETDLMRRLNHPNITKILEQFETEKYILIILEYINGGNLFTFVKKRRKLPEKTAKFLFKQIIQGIKYIHSNNIVHRDIKLENILIDLNNNIKICDFGIGKIINKNNSILYDQCGTPMYMAPEILLSSKNKGYEPFPIDIWSAGIALYIMLSGILPFSVNNETENNFDLQYSIINNEPKIIENISTEAQNLLNRLLDKNPKNRIKINEILNHPWLKNCDENKFNLFTKAEMILLSKTFVDYRFAENIKENFTLSNLNKDDVNFNNNVNIETKSNILAPYNTIIINNNNNSFENDFEENEIFNDLNNKEIQIQNEILLFSNKIREFNLNYELNNNNECDNGILINMKTESLNSTFNNNLNEEIYENKNNFNEKQREENILNKIENDFGYKKDYVKKSIENNDLNHARAIFYLMMNYEHI